MHDAHLGCPLFFLDMLAGYTLRSMTVMVTPCLWYVVGMNLVCPMSKFPQAPFAAPLLANPEAKEARKSPSKLRRKLATNFAENFANFTLEIAGA